MKDFDSILVHFGVKGMKWGVRQRRLPKTGPSDDAKKSHAAYKKSKRSGVEALTNTELKNLNNRLQLELTYSQLAAQPTRLEKGLKLVKTVVTVGKSYDSVAKLTGQKQIKDILGAKKAGGIANTVVTANAGKKMAKKAAKKAKKAKTTIGP